MPDAWNPEQYQRFKRERSQPFHDLAALIDITALEQGTGTLRLVDLGCGTGALTSGLHSMLQQKLPGRRLLSTGIDNSPAMLAQSGEFAMDSLSFELGSIEDLQPEEPFDIIFSNAALQWVPDHELLFARLSLMLKSGGQLLVQMPANFSHPSQLAAVEIAMRQPFSEELGGFARQSPVLPPEWYAETLHRLGFGEINVRLQVYTHLLDSRDEVVEWVKGTLLTPYSERLSPELYEDFVNAYRQRLHELLPASRPYFYTFKRILIWGRKK